MRFDTKCRTAEPWIKEGTQAAHWTHLLCHRFRANEVRLQLSVCADSLRNLWCRWSLTSIQQRFVKTGGRLVKHARYYLGVFGREPSVPTRVRDDAPSGLRATGPGRLTRGACKHAGLATRGHR